MKCQFVGEMTGATFEFDDQIPLLVGCRDQECQHKPGYRSMGTEFLPDGSMRERVHWHCGNCNGFASSGWVAPRCCFDGKTGKLLKK